MDMDKLSSISHLVSEHLVASDEIFKKAIRSNVALLNVVTRYMVRKKGKQMRPLFVLLSAGMHGHITPSAHRAAALIELLHTATLIHDDVVDDAHLRRGLLSVNALWKNKIAVLVGDYLLSRGLLLALEHKEFEQLRIVSDATREMSEGELLQIEKARRLDLSEELYFDIIRKKTASLIASCCAAGASAAGASEEDVQKMHQFGELAGIAFQIRDDLFDYQQLSDIGKPSGIDLKEKKFTLPMLYMLKQLSPLKRAKMIMEIRYGKLTGKRVSSIFREVELSGGMAYAERKMEHFSARAIEALSSFVENPYAEGLKKLVDYTVIRKR